MKLENKDADEIKADLKSTYGVDTLGDVPRSAIMTRVHDMPVELQVEWLTANYNVKEIAYFADRELDFVEYQAGMRDSPEGIKYDDPEEGSNIMSSEELAELATRLGQVEDKVRRIKNNRDRYSNKFEQTEAELERKQEELAEYKNAGRLHHLKRLVLG